MGFDLSRDDHARAAGLASAVNLSDRPARLQIALRACANAWTRRCWALPLYALYALYALYEGRLDKIPPLAARYGGRYRVHGSNITALQRFEQEWQQS
jgi:hypothetical protein